MVAVAVKRKHSKPLAIVATRIVQEALNDDVELATLAQLAASDPGFAARIVSAVNSGAFAMSRTVSDVRQACSMLGVRGLRNLALSLVVSDMIPTGEEGTLLLVNSLRRAVAARLVAEALGERQPDEFFTTGLFLEIGLLQAARGDLARTADVARVPAAHRPTYERACGRVDHPAAGAELAKNLKLPESVVTAVAEHHARTAPTALMSRIAWAAERIAGAFEGGDVVRLRKDALEAARVIGVKTEAAAALFERVPDLVTATAAAFDRQVPAQEKLDALVLDANRRLVEMNNSYEQILRQLEQLLTEKDELTARLQRANEELANVAATDPLTGVPNRRAFEEAIKRDLARAERTKTPLALVMIDIDHFKKVNDTYGHSTGDAVLKKMADVLKLGLRTGDIPARLGGEEFVALLPGSDAEGGRIVAERLRASLAATEMPGPSGVFKVTASFGVAAYRGGPSAGVEKTLLDQADALLYESKHGGRNRVTVAK
jgi:two-component system cell cycle response regulator